MSPMMRGMNTGGYYPGPYEVSHTRFMSTAHCVVGLNFPICPNQQTLYCIKPLSLFCRCGVYLRCSILHSLGCYINTELLQPVWRGCIGFALCVCVCLGPKSAFKRIKTAQTRLKTRAGYAGHEIRSCW